MDGNLIANTDNWEAGKDYPAWMDEISLATISKGYLLPGETPKKAYRRVASAAAMRLKKPELENKLLIFTALIEAVMVSSARSPV